MPPESLSRASANSKMLQMSLSQKILALKRSTSVDPVQRLQTEVIVELFQAVKEIQDHLWGQPSGLPNVSDVREAAAAQNTTVQAKKLPPHFGR